MELIRRMTAGNPGWLIRPIAATVLANLCGMLPYALASLAVMRIYEAFADTGATLAIRELWLLCAGMLVSLVLLYASESLAYRLSFGGAYGLAAEGRRTLAEHLRKLPLGTLMRRDAGELGNMMMGDFAQLETANSQLLPQIVGGMIASLLAVIGFLFLDWRMALAMIAGFPPALLILWAVSGLERKYGTSHAEARSRASSRLQEYIQGMKVIKAYNMRGGNFTGLEQAFRRLMKESISLEGRFGPVFLVAIALVKSGAAFILIAGSYLAVGGELSVPALAAFLLIGARVYEPIAGAIFAWPEFKYYALYGGRIADMLAEPAMPGDRPSPSGHDVEFRDVEFGYGDEPVLRGVSFAVRAGTLTAVVGPSGSGKSTVLKLIARFYDPRSGEVRIGGRPAKEMAPEALMQKLSMVFQDVYLFNDTIGNNIRYGRQGATQQEVEEAARQACCHEFISRLPGGYDTMVGEGGSTLSGGEKQRIAVARAMIKQAPIVLLDEATASLDPENEAEMQRAISRLVAGRTVIVIAHRLKTVVEADRIIVLERGKVAEQGGHEQLVCAGGLYARLWRLQQETEQWGV
ncbi:ABC transporter ATP-binding protein [Cohnella sp.]|uniref:ABC transporter ATP-binding protein n=1 Tax=Cohnella sp. TaxID=1883426 RepID=UPI003704A4AB